MSNLPLKLISYFILILFTINTTVYADDEISYASDNWQNWKEHEVTSFPEFDLKRSIAIELDPHSQLQWYVDPNTISIGEDRIVRYVVLAVSKSNIINASYEGIFCKNNTYKVYARAIGQADQSTFKWREISTQEWKELANAPPFGHERTLARLVMCEQSSSPKDVISILSRLKSPYSDL